MNVTPEPTIFAEIGPREAISSGVLLFAKGDSVVIRPFPDEPDYLVDIEVIIDQPDGDRVKIEPQPNGRPKLTARTHFKGALPTAHLDVPLAHTETHNYGIAFSYALIGDEDRYAVTLSYMISRKPRT